MGSVAASGGLYSALSASKIFAQPGTMTGSIGVILQIPNVAKIADEYKFSMTTIKSGKFKDVGNMFREMTDEERAYLQETIMIAYHDFVNAVSEGRQLDPKNIESFADGRVILGTQAKELKLIDEFGDVHEAARAIFEILGQPLSANEQPSLFYPGDKFGALKDVLEGASSLLPKHFRANMELLYMM